MMRLARRASLLVTLCLLTAAATAYAECAWVLWAQLAEVVGTPDTLHTDIRHTITDAGWSAMGAYQEPERV